MECKYDYWGGMTAAGTAFPTLPGLFSSSSESWHAPHGFLLSVCAPSSDLVGLYGGFGEWIDHFIQLQDAPVDGELPDTEERVCRFWKEWQMRYASRNLQWIQTPKIYQEKSCSSCFAVVNVAKLLVSSGMDESNKLPLLQPVEHADQQPSGFGKSKFLHQGNEKIPFLARQ